MLKRGLVGVFVAVLGAGAIAGDDGLVASFDFNKLDNGVFLDASPSAIKAKCHNAELCEGVDGCGLLLKGHGSSVNFDLPEKSRNLSAVSVEAWLSPDEVRHAHVVCATGAKPGAPASFSLRWRTNWEFWIQVTTADGVDRNLQCFRPVVDSISFPKRKWFHVVGTHDGESSAMYVDGKLVMQKKFDGGPKALKPVDGQVMLGGPGEVFIGGMDNLRIFNRALTGEEVAARFAARSGFHPEVPPSVQKKVANTIDGLPYAPPGWKSVPLKRGELRLSNNGLIQATSINPGPHSDVGFMVGLIDQEQRGGEFYKELNGNLGIP